MSYLKSRFTSLKPGKTRNNKHLIPTLRCLNRNQWLFFLVSLAAWTWDAFDFFTVSITVTEIATELNRTVTEITWGITLVLMLRSVGALAFGYASDKYGRKWPFIVNCVMFSVLELGTGFVTTYKQFLAVRALFGIAMGGIYGNCAATALEDCPVEAKGIVSGMLQQGYALGYLLAVVFNRALTHTTRHGWRSLFWFGACPPVLIILLRLYLPETEAYTTRKHFFKIARKSMAVYWRQIVHMVLLMAMFNFMSHGSQDLYPTLLRERMPPDKVTIVMVVSTLGAISGGIVIGYVSGIVGRRASVMAACILGGTVVYPWAFVRNDGIIAAAFVLQFMVQGAWGVVPVYLSDLSPRSLRAFTVGTAYQLGNLASSASSTIEATLAARLNYEYDKVMAIFMACVFFLLFVVVFLGQDSEDFQDQQDHEHSGLEQDQNHSNEFGEKGLHEDRA